VSVYLGKAPEKPLFLICGASFYASKTVKDSKMRDAGEKNSKMERNF
jgi:hypothetical protein